MLQEQNVEERQPPVLNAMLENKNVTENHLAPAVFSGESLIYVDGLKKKQM